MKLQKILLIGFLFSFSVGYAEGHHRRKYGEATTVNFALYATDGTALKVDAVCAAGDIEVMKDEAAEASSTNCFVDEGQGYSLALTAAEMQADRVVLYVTDDTGTQTWLDKVVVIETYDDGNGDGQHVAQNVTVGDIAVAALAKFSTTDTGETTPLSGSVAELSQGTASGLTAAGVADAVWDEAACDHVTPSTFGGDVLKIIRGCP